MIIKLFEDFSSDNEFYIFDFDETLSHGHDYEHLAWNYLNEDMSQLVDRSLEYIGVSKDDVQKEDDRLFVYDPENEIDVKGNWIRKGKRIYMLTPNKWSFIDESFPYELLPLSNLYKSVKNKAIVTARPEDVREKLVVLMGEFGLEQPNYGLHMFPRIKGIGTAASWKARTIISLIEESGYKRIYFYDDNAKILNKVTKEVNKHFKDLILFKSFRVKEHGKI